MEVRHRHTRTGFTLIELLVVIAIIAILAAILFPVFVSAKASANKSRCVSNIKQLADAVGLYRNDCGTYPYSARYPGPLGKGVDYLFWMEMLRPYVRSTGVFRCPSATDAYSSWANGNTWIMAHFQGANYGINEFMVYNIWGPYYIEARIPKSSKTAMIADCNCQLFNDFGDNLVTTDGVTLVSGMARMLAHDNRGNQARHDTVQIVFADCHARSIKRTEFAFTGDIRLPWPGVKRGYHAEYPIVDPEAGLLPPGGK